MAMWSYNGNEIYYPPLNPVNHLIKRIIQVSELKKKKPEKSRGKQFKQALHDIHGKSSVIALAFNIGTGHGCISSRNLWSIALVINWDYSLLSSLYAIEEKG